jgi:predicted transcriptional regulator
MRVLGHLEAKVMDVVWSSGTPVAVRQVHEALRSSHPVAYTTVLTVMDNLHGKGMLDRDRDGRAYLYTPTLAREDYGAELMAQVLAGSSNRAGTLLRFAEHIDGHEADELRQALEARSTEHPR